MTRYKWISRFWDLPTVASPADDKLPTPIRGVRNENHTLLERDDFSQKACERRFPEYVIDCSQYIIITENIMYIQSFPVRSYFQQYSR